MNFCIETPIPSQTQKLAPTVQRLHREIRLGCWFIRYNGTDPPPNPYYDPKLYIKDGKRFPDITNQKIEARFLKFNKLLTKSYNGMSTYKQYNLIPHQRHTISELKKRKDLIIGSTDKNLGPFIRPRKLYIQDCLKDHLSKEDYYDCLSKKEATDRLSKMSDDLRALYTKHHDFIPDHHCDTYFDRALVDLSLIHI